VLASVREFSVVIADATASGAMGSSLTSPARVRTSLAGVSVFGLSAEAASTSNPLVGMTHGTDAFTGAYVVLLSRWFGMPLPTYECTPQQLTTLLHTDCAELLAFYPTNCILDLKDGVEGGDMFISLQVQPRQVLRKRENLGPQMPFLDTTRLASGDSSSSDDDGAGGVGLGGEDDYEQQLARAYPWVMFHEIETADVLHEMKAALAKHTGSVAESESDQFAARRCYDPVVLAYWSQNPGSRVVRSTSYDPSHCVVRIASASRDATASMWARDVLWRGLLCRMH
jgi:hypothetical protein